jgi:hypothetical protein
MWVRHGIEVVCPTSHGVMHTTISKEKMADRNINGDIEYGHISTCMHRCKWCWNNDINKKGY